MTQTTVNCPDCTREIQIDDQWGNFKCPHCGESFDIEVEPEREIVSHEVPTATAKHRTVSTSTRGKAKANASQPPTRKPGELSTGQVAAYLLVGLCVIGFLGGREFGCFKSHPKPSPPRPKPAAASQLADMSKRISGKEWLGCTDRAYFEKLTQYATQRDAEAFGQALTNGFLAGTCTKFVDGETVYICDTSVFRGLVKVRRKGDTKEYWTNLEAVK